MAGMLQIITYLLAFYLIVKGFEILQIGLSSNRPDRSGVITLGIMAIIFCSLAAVCFVMMQDQQAMSLSSVGK